VWLHGPDDDERQVTRVMPLVSMRNYVAVGPRGTAAGQVPRSFTWSQEPAQIAVAHDRVCAAIRAARRWLNIAPERIYLAGYGCGGTMALRVALARPAAFAGVISLGGGFPAGHCPLADLHGVRQLKIMLATGRDSADYPEPQVCQHLRLFHAAGMSVDLRQYPCGDELTTNMLSDVDRWIMGQLNAPAAVEADQATQRGGR
jgi:phospholipase/carboxylesterase